LLAAADLRGQPRWRACSAALAAPLIGFAPRSAPATHPARRPPRRPHPIRASAPRRPAAPRRHAGALLREAQAGGAAIADAFAGRLPGADHDGDLVLETYGAESRLN
jgi:hypothetical protein